MPQAATPRYLGQDFSACPPGHRFTLYGAFWEPQDWSRMKNIDPDALKRDFGALPGDVVKLRDALCKRQKLAADALGMLVTPIHARSISPFVTGTGIEHPLENGMAFLNPYGLPYLPGSSVKGVLRRAGEELSDNLFGEGTKGWDAAAIEILFGKETESGETETEHARGALVFWDAFPRCDRLAVEIMHPHYGDYYQGNATPHDAGQPIPIYFLVVPEKTDFTFHVQCDSARLPEDWPEGKWRELTRAAYEHAFDWLGFGAKTAVGYGAMMARDAVLLSHEQRPEPEAQRSAAPAAPTKVATETRWESARIKFNARNGTLTAIGPGNAEVYAYADKGRGMFNSLPASVQQRIRNGQPVKVAVRVRGKELLAIEAAR